MKIESHLENLKESLREIEEAIRTGLENKQRTLAFHTSSGGADMFEIILHKHNLLDPGFMVKHEWFNSKNILIEKFPSDFPKKEEILELLQKIEKVRNNLCYGKRQKEEILLPLVSDFNKLKELFSEVTNYEL